MMENHNLFSLRKDLREILRQRQEALKTPIPESDQRREVFAILRDLLRRQKESSMQTGKSSNLEAVPIPNETTLTPSQCHEIFHGILNIILEEKPFFFSNALFIREIAKKYLVNNNKDKYFTTDKGFSAFIVVENGVAVPHIELGIEALHKSQTLRKRATLRLGVQEPTEEELFRFAAAHELGHLIQGLVDVHTLDDYDVSDKSEDEIEELRQKIAEYNKSIAENEQIKKAQAYFRLVFRNDINRDWAEAKISAEGYKYTDEEYLAYLNSDPEVNADYISLWIMGMENPDMQTSPQNEGYRIHEWRRWAENHRIDITQIK